MGIGVRQKFILLLLSGLFVSMGLIGTYRFLMEKRAIVDSARAHGEQTSRLMAELASPFLLKDDLAGLRALSESFMHSPDVGELTVSDHEGRQVAHNVRPDQSGQGIAVGPVVVHSGDIKLGEIRFSFTSADIDRRLRAYAVSVVVECIFISVLLTVIIFILVSRFISSPIRDLGNSLKDMIDHKDITRRVEFRRQEEIGAVAGSVNHLLDRLERIVREMGVIAGRIGDLGPATVADSREITKNAEIEAAAITNTTASVEKMTTSIQSIAENAESLSNSAEEASSAIIEMNAANQEVANHTGELTTAVEEVTTSVLEMIASIREVAGHVEALSSAAEETSASAVQIEATVREVEQSAKESARLSQQASIDARDMEGRSLPETMKAIDRIRDAVSRYSGLVTRLGKRSEEIGTILGVIVDVTERTNLLALNASILAAQAGEHGRGFAVVAEEIKALAERTAGSTQDISLLINAVQKEAREAVAAISESLAAVEEGVARGKEADAALQKILTSSGRSAETAMMIGRAMTEQARGIRQVSEAIVNVRQMMQQISFATQAQSKGTEMILKAAEDMRDISHKVREVMNKQGRGSKQIIAAMENVTERSGQIAAGTWEQQQASQQILATMGGVQDLPNRNIKRVESMAAALKTLGEQADLLRQEIAVVAIQPENGKRGV